MVSISECIISYILLFILGSSLGSFFSLIVSRIAKKQSIILPSSHCVNCRNQLKVYDLIPVFSWIHLRGKCRMCYKQIPISYLLSEILSGVVVVVLYYVLEKG